MRFRSSVHLSGTLAAFLSIAFLYLSASAFAANPDATIARCGAGFVENVGGYRVLHLKGSPYEMGFQHGTLLKDDIRELVRFLFEEKAKEADFKLFGQIIEPKAIIKVIVGEEKLTESRREKNFCSALTPQFR